MKKLSKGIIGYEKNIALGVCTVKSGMYLWNRLKHAEKFALEEIEELHYLYQKFERNIDKIKRKKIIASYTRI
jgi:hypothetical protein